MHVGPSFAVKPLAWFFKFATFTPLFLVSTSVLAQTTVDGIAKTIDASTGLDNYLVRNGGSLLAQGAETHQIRVESGSQASLDGTSVTALGSAVGVDVSASQATLTNSTVVSTSTGLRLAQTPAGGGSTVLVSNSTVIGGRMGAVLGKDSVLTLEAGSSVIGSDANGMGVRSFGGKVFASAKGLAVQQVEATGPQTHRASVLLLNAQQLLRVNPGYVPAVKKAASVPLTDDPTLLPELPRRWRVAGGGGTVDAFGHYRAPDEGITASSVVQCEIVRNGVVFSSGYSVIDLSELEPRQSWEELSQFTIKVPNGLDPTLGSMFRNGYQQLRAQIVVETALVNQKPYPLSPREKSTLRLVDNISKAEIPFVSEALEGIPEGDEHTWRTNLRANRFELANQRSAVESEEPDAGENISIVDIYLHTRERANLSSTFHVKFRRDNGDWFESEEYTDLYRKITVSPTPIPNFVHEDYSFKRVRVDGGSAAPNDPDDDDFDFRLRTLDYWSLAYVGRYPTEAAPFETLEFLPVDGASAINTSIIRWESEQLAETMFSWTGYIFQDPSKDPDISKIKFDEAAKDVIGEQESLDVDVVPRHFEQGKLVITLHRSDRVAYVRATDPSRAKLTGDLVVALIDHRGNPHKRRIIFKQKDAGVRNELDHVLFTPLP